MITNIITKILDKYYAAKLADLNKRLLDRINKNNKVLIKKGKLNLYIKKKSTLRCFMQINVHDSFYWIMNIEQLNKLIIEKSRNFMEEK